jgi:cation:H+ antiporter
MLAALFLISVVICAASALLYRSCGWLEQASHRLSECYGVPDIVRGSVITAVSSSVPELATAVLAIPVHGDFELGRRSRLPPHRALVPCAALFSLVSVTSLVLVLCLAVIYGGSGVSASNGPEPVYGLLTWPFAASLLLLYGLYLFIQFEEVRDHRRVVARDESVNALREWGILLGCIALILLGVELLLLCAIELGTMLGTPTFLWGLTVVAAATSIPDTFISVRAASAGRSESSTSNVLGSNIFDLLVAVPVGVLVVGEATVNFSQAIPMMGFLMIATVAMLAFMRRDMRVTPSEAVWMLILYMGFGLWITAEAFGLTTVLGIPTP